MTVLEEKFKRRLSKSVRRYGCSAAICSVFHYITNLLPIVIGVVAAVYITALDVAEYDQRVLLSLSLVGTALSTVGAFIDFKSQWRANRNTSSALRIILYKLDDPNYRALGTYWEDFENVIRKHPGEA